MDLRRELGATLKRCKRTALLLVRNEPPAVCVADSEAVALVASGTAVSWSRNDSGVNVAMAGELTIWDLSPIGVPVGLESSDGFDMADIVVVGTTGELDEAERRLVQAAQTDRAIEIVTVISKAGCNSTVTVL